MNRRKCVIPNYIPYRPQKKIRYSEWYNEYIDELNYMFRMTRNIIQSKYEECDIDFEDFCLLIFDNSSKYIREY